MSKTIDVVEVSNDSFSDLYSIVSQLSNAFSTSVGVAANSTGEGTAGNGYVVGVFSANTIAVVNELRGGSVSSPANLAITSNLSVNGALVSISTDNVRVVAQTSVLAVNSSIDVITVFGNSSVATVTVGGTYANVTANVEFNGQKFRIPVGNTTARPAGTAGLLRYNDETNLLEIYSSGAWQSFVSYSNTFTASAVVFESNANVSSNNVQAAIEEVWNEKASKIGDTFTGNVAISRNSQPLPTPSFSGLQVGAADASTTGVELVSFANSNAIIAKRAEGTNASKSVIANNSPILTITGSAWDGSAFANDVVGIDLMADQSHNSSAKGTRLVVKATANGATTPQEVLVIRPGNVAVNAAVSALSLVLTGAFTGNTATLTNLTVSANLIANGALLTTINATSISTGTLASARMTAANTSVNGAIQIANTSEFIANSNNTKALTPGYVWIAAQEVALTYSGTTVVSSGNTGINMASFINASITLTQNSTLGQPVGVKAGQSGCIRIVQDGTGSRTLSYHADWEFAGGSAPTLSTAAGTNDLLFYYCIASGRVYANLIKAVS